MDDLKLGACNELSQTSQVELQETVRRCTALA